MGRLATKKAVITALFGRWIIEEYDPTAAGSIIREIIIDTARRCLSEAAFPPLVSIIQNSVMKSTRFLIFHGILGKR